MLVAADRRKGLEDVLRSLGALLDERMSRGILITEVEGGLVVRAQVARSVDQRIGGAWVALERVYDDADLLAQQLASCARRGSSHVAGPIERALRVLGHLADARELSGITLIQHDSDGGWLLWHRSALDGRTLPLVFTNGDLDGLAAAATKLRQKRVKVPAALASRA